MILNCNRRYLLQLMLLSLSFSKGTFAMASPKAESLVMYFSMPETDNPNNMTRDEENSAVVVNGKVLGNVQYLAELIAEKTGSDIFRILPVNPYPTNHKELVERARREKDQNFRPAIQGPMPDLSKYKVIFLGYPMWWYEVPMIIRTLLEKSDFSGKTIIPFNVNGGSDYSNTIDIIRQYQPKAKVITNGISISRNRISGAETPIDRWLKTLELP